MNPVITSVSLSFACYIFFALYNEPILFLQSASLAAHRFQKFAGSLFSASKTLFANVKLAENWIYFSVRHGSERTYPHLAKLSGNATMLVKLSESIHIEFTSKCSQPHQHKQCSWNHAMGRLDGFEVVIFDYKYGINEYSVASFISFGTELFIV